MALIDDFKRSPNPDRVILITIEAAWVLNTADWTAVPATNRYIADWEWHPRKPLRIYEWNGTTKTLMTEASSVANCNSTDTSWYYDESAISAGTIHINPTGAGIGTKDYIIDWPLRVGTKAKTFTVSSRAVTWEAVVLGSPRIARALPLLGPLASPATCSFTLMADWVERLIERGIIYNRPVTIQIGGGVQKGDTFSELPLADYITRFSGYTSSGETRGRLSINPHVKELTIPCIDKHALFTAVSPEDADGAYKGRADQILDDAFTDAGLTSPSVESGFTTARPWEMILARPAPQTVQDIIRTINQHLCVLYTKADGTLLQSWWRSPDGAETLQAAYREKDDPIHRAVSLDIDYSLYATNVIACLLSGLRGTKKLSPTSNDRGEEEIEKIVVNSGWTRLTGYNVWYRPCRFDVVDVRKCPVTPGASPVPYLRMNTWGDADTDDESWAQVVDASGGDARLYINPTGGTSPNTFDICIYRKVEKNRTSTSKTGADDTTVQVSASAASLALYGKAEDRLVNTLLVKKTEAQTFADTLLGFTRQPLEIRQWDSALNLHLGVDLNGRITFEKMDGTVLELRVLEIIEDYASERTTIKAWRLHAGGLD